MSEENVIDYKQLYEDLKKEFNDYKEQSVKWSIEDFEHQALQNEKRHFSGDPTLMELANAKVLYNRDEFNDALLMMIYRHDAEHGICWETLSYWLDEKCRIKHDEKITLVPEEAAWYWMTKDHPVYVFNPREGTESQIEEKWDKLNAITFYKWVQENVTAQDLYLAIDTPEKATTDE